MKSFLYFLFFSVVSPAVSGQEAKEELISVNLKDVSIDKLVKDIEQKTSYHFYYDPAQFDSLRINIVADQQPLDEVLKQVFSNTIRSLLLMVIVIYVQLYMIFLPTGH